jgi:hypothetical protein
MITVLSLESLYFKHPTFFSSKYLTGSITLAGNDSVDVKPQDWLVLFASNIYCTRSYTKISIVDVLYTIDNLLYFVMELIRDALPDELREYVKMHFYDGSDNQFIYNDPANVGLTLEQFAHPNVGDPAIPHVQLLDRMFQTRDMNCQLVFANVPGVHPAPPSITLNGAFFRMLGLDPNKPHVIDAKGLNIRLPISGLDFVAVTSNLVIGQMSSLFSSSVSNSDLLQIVHTHDSVPGEMVHFFNTSSSGKVELGVSILDTIQFRFYDEFGYPLLGMEDFIATVVIDHYIPTPMPEQDRFRLDHARNLDHHQTRQEIRKKLKSDKNRYKI